MKNFYNNQSFSFSVILSEQKRLNPADHRHDVAWRLKDDYRFDPSFWRIWIILSGRGRVITTTDEIDVEENKIYLMPPNTVVSTVLYTPMEQYYIDFVQNSDEISIEQLYNFRRVAKKEDFELLLLLAKSIYNLYPNPNELSNFTVSTTITTILAHFIDFSSEEYGKFKKALKYISENYSHQIPLTYLANLSNYSPEYFSAKFKTTFGMSPQKFIIHKRLSQAKLLLISTTRSIREIGEEVGYPDQMHFSKLFTNEVGTTPSEYRKSYSHKSAKTK